MNFLRIFPQEGIPFPLFCRIIYANIYHSTYSIRPNMAIVARELVGLWPSGAKCRPLENAASRRLFRRATTRNYFVPESFRDRSIIPSTCRPVLLVIHFWERFVDILPWRINNKYVRKYFER